jgi:hypothetical protein
VWLDQELGGRIDRTRCEEGEQVCDVCAEGEQMVETEAFPSADVQPQAVGSDSADRMWDSGIGMSSSMAMPSSPPSHPAVLSSILSQSEPRQPSSSIASPRHSISSVQSFDQGVATDITPIDTIDQIQFQRQQEEHYTSGAYTRTYNIAQSQNVHQLQQQLE